MPVTKSDSTIERLKELRGTSGLSWHKIAALDEFRPIPAGTLHKMVKTGRIGPKWRGRLGLPEQAKVESINGSIPDGSVSLGALLCGCGRWFISNHPRRKRCFVCGPYRGKQSKQGRQGKQGRANSD